MRVRKQKRTHTNSLITVGALAPALNTGESRDGRLWFRFGLAALGCALVASLVGVIPAQAAKPAPSSVVVQNTNDSGPGSLRQALVDVPSGGTIKFSLGAPATITLTSGQLEIAKSLTIQGPGASALTVSGPGASCTTCFRVFEVDETDANSDPITATISGLRIANGNNTDFASPGGGIANSGTLIVTNSTLSGNSAASYGGGILNSGTLAVTNSTLSGNFAAFFGGGLRNDGALTVTNSTLSNNFASSGGAISNTGALTVTNSILSGNSAFSSGASSSVGGGIFNSSGALTVTNSTLSGNSASSSGSGATSGGGIINFGNTLTVTNSTVSDNSASSSGSGASSAGGIRNFATLTVTNAIVSANSPDNCLFDFGSFADGGNNLQFPGSSCPFTVNAVSADPLLGALQNNGGPTQTRALPQNSPAIDAGGISACNAPAPPPVTNTGAGGLDQRGATRGADGNGDAVAGCDIGAFELNDADLAVTTDAPATVTSGQTLTYAITITNNGPLADSFVVLRDTIPNGTRFLSATPSQGTCTSPGRSSSVVVCNIGQINAGNIQGATIVIKVSPSTTGPLQNIARVSGSRFDPNGSNNTAVTITQATK